MDPERAVPEIARVLRDGGRFGLIWTGRDREVDSVRELDRLPGEDTSEADSPDRFQRRHRLRPAGAANLRQHRARDFRFARPMTVDDVVAMLGTYSRAIIASPDDRATALADARAALDARFPGADTIDVPMRAFCWRADRIARGGVD